MQYLLRTFGMAINALRRNILRSMLTTLGIIIGVGAVIAMVEIGQGASKAVQATIQSMGADNLLVQPGAASSGGATFGSGSATGAGIVDSIAAMTTSGTGSVTLSGIQVVTDHPITSGTGDSQ